MEKVEISRSIEHVENNGRGKFYIQGEEDDAAAMMYHHWKDGTIINIDHTEVDDDYQGQGLGRTLLIHLVDWAKEKGVKVSATCPFALATFEKHPNLTQGILVPYQR